MSSEINQSYFVQKIITISFALSLPQLVVSGGIDLAFLIMIVTTPSLTPITFPRAIVSVILTPDKLFVFLTISTFALDGIVTTKLSPTFGVLLISPILITNLSLEAETIFA